LTKMSTPSKTKDNDIPNGVFEVVMNFVKKNGMMIFDEKVSSKTIKRYYRLFKIEQFGEILEYGYECFKKCNDLHKIRCLIPYTIVRSMLLIRIVCDFGFLIKFDAIQKKKIKKSESEELSKDLMEKEKRKFDEIIKECFIPVITLFDHEVFLIACDLIIKNDNKEAQNQLFIWTGLLDYKKIEKPKVDEGPVNMSIGEILFKNEPKNKEKKKYCKRHRRKS